MYATAQIAAPHRSPMRCAGHPAYWKGKHMSLGMILLIVLILVLVGVLPTWPHSRSWGRGPSGGVGLVLLVLIVLVVLGKI
jgi:hypothetical protein